MLKKDYKVGIIGLGYVGIPLFNEIFNKKIKVVGYDNSIKRINYLKKNENYKNHISNNSSILVDCNIYLVCVPTPVNNTPLWQLQTRPVKKPYKKVIQRQVKT